MRRHTILTVALLAAGLAGADELDGLIAALGDPSWSVREEAMSRLVEFGPEAEERLRALRSTDPEVRWRADDVLDRLARMRTSIAHLTVVYCGESTQIVQGGVGADDPGDLGQGLVVEGVWRGPRFDGRLAGHPIELEADRIRFVGRFDGRGVYALARRDARWELGDVDGARDRIARALAGEIERPLDVGVPDAFRLLLEADGFEDLVAPLGRRGRASSDPFVRRLCARAIARQRQLPLPIDDPDRILEEAPR